MNFKKSASIIAASLFSAATIMPVGTASAHDRHNPNSHYGHGQHLSKHQHRQFHHSYGRGYDGTHNYREQQRQHDYRAQQRQHHQKHTRSNRRNKKGDLIAAGIIGLAVGAIIAGQASKRKNHRSHQPAYNNPPTRFNQPTRNHIPLDNYDNRSPNVITFNEPNTLEPWTPGWKQWCQNRYRSFNPSTGTFRGYDGLDHFCVPK